MAGPIDRSAALGLGRRLELAAQLRTWRPVWSRAAAMRAVRATVVVPGLFAIADKLVGNLQMATFAAFGGFATLVLAAFAGNRRDKLIAHGGLALAGSALLVIGTAVNSSVAVAAIATVPVAFAVFFAGVAGPNAASGATAALLAYVLPAASPGTIAMIPDRLAGWWLASLAGTAAVLAFSPAPGGDRLRRAAARVAGTLADQLEAMLAGEANETGLAACVEAKHELLAQFTATPFRPTGLATADQALANAVELLEWCTSLILDSAHERGDLRDAAEPERALLNRAAGVLRDAGSRLAGADAGRRLDRPELDGLEAERVRSLRQLRELGPGRAGFTAQARLSFHAHSIAVTALAIDADALLATGIADADWVAEARTRWFGGETLPDPAGRLGRTHRFAGVAARHASVRSVWFVNSLRGAVALAAAVAVADLSSVQHGFWVVLGTLSVLRTNAAATGATALRALLGTVVGFAIGGALLLAIGTSSTALWVAFPIAVFVAAYAPGTAPFAIGQAAFTVTVAVLFNLLVPAGWQVGLVRIEDVAIGCAVSVVAGTLLWPRGVASVVGDDLADAFRAGAVYLSQAIEWVSGLREHPPAGAVRAIAAGVRLDDALRAFLAEQGSKRIDKHELWRLVGGTMRLRLTAHAVAGLPRDGAIDLAVRAELERRAETLTGWYHLLAEQVDRPRGTPLAALAAPRFDPPEPDTPTLSHHAIWLHEYLGHLAEHLGELVPPAVHLAEIRRRPWWR
ncbi:MAG: FUSC family protein [Solirubrobacterales bacterium]|nr:FUSC family protein [Solirubrobacterales bacterium]